ncbi:MAG: ThiJ/PfpI domain protein [Sphingomonadales bacterium]|nr:ThiJ/PfpI domain protein [Sphingomonadales bacterium]
MDRREEEEVVDLGIASVETLGGGTVVLVGRCATTHRDAMDELRDLNCGAEILADVRVVDNGRIISSAGISAGIDAALYVVARMFGESSASRIARYMQYDWHDRTAYCAWLCE